MDRFLRIIKVSLFGLVILCLAGLFGYMHLEKFSPLDALYLTITTITTVGYGDIHPVTPEGRIFTIILILCGVGFVLFTISRITQTIIEGEFHEVYGRKRVEKKIAVLKNHYIICGCGRIGSLVAKELHNKKVPFVVIENDPEILYHIESLKYLALKGDATDEDVLNKARIAEAKGLVAALRTDADNVYVTLSAKALNPGIFVLARAQDEGAESKLINAGASKVVSPYLIGGSRMALAILKPSVVDFIDIATHSDNIDLQIEELKVLHSSKLIGMTLKESEIRKELGIIIIAIKKPHAKMHFNPSPSTKIDEGDILIAIGDKEGLQSLSRLLE